MPLIEVGKKPPLLGQDRPILVYSAYLGCIGMLVAAALKVDLTSYCTSTHSPMSRCAPSAAAVSFLPSSGTF